MGAGLFNLNVNIQHYQIEMFHEAFLGIVCVLRHQMGVSLTVLCSVGLMQNVALYLFPKRQPSSV